MRISSTLMVAIGLATFAGVAGFNAPAKGCDCEASLMDEPQTPPNPDAAYELKGDVRAHDPSMAKEGHTYYMFCTGPGISIRSSTDRITWSPPIKAFDKPWPWTGQEIPRSGAFYWAPDISFFNRKWHLYYAVSTFGRNRSAIGLATNVTLDPKRPDYKWVDEGPVFQSYPTDNYNAIDPNVGFDEHGQPWLSFGSFWSGIQILKLDKATGKLADPNERPAGIASRPHTDGQPGAIEAPFIIRHGRFFYLWTSFDFCCRGVNSTYNIRVGRSPKIDGPYVDKEGKPLMEGGGTLVLAATGRWHGPGGNSVLHDGRQDLLIYHSYDAKDNGIPKLRIDPIVWDRDGWPEVTIPEAYR